MSATGYSAELNELLEMPLEQLVNVEVTTASKFPQKTMDAPAAVTVITADDIRDYGYRTFADVLRSIRGVYMTYDRTYEYLGVRGFGPSGDYNSRLLLMIDGRRVNDVIYDQAFVGTDGIIDLENVARIEFVPGSGSSIYGSNAVFGVMNVITKQGKDLNTAELAGNFGSYGMDREKATAGYRFENGADVLVSASRYRSEGHTDLYFSEYDQPGLSDGDARHLDGDQADRFFTKFSYGDFALEGAFSDRKKTIPIALYSVDFNIPESYRDRNGFVEARYEKPFTDWLTTSARAYWGMYDFDGRYRFSGIKNLDVQVSQWSGMEIKNLLILGDHKLVFGGEYQNNFQQQMRNFDASPRTDYLNVATSSYRYGIYLQDDYAILSNLTLNAGVRFTHYSVSGNAINPRIALIYKPWNEFACKLLYGTAFRAPNLYELYYQGPYQLAFGGLRPEKIQSLEAVLEYQPLPNLRLTATGFQNHINDLINLIPYPANPAVVMYTNTQQVQMEGTEFEGEYRWNNGTRLRASYAFAYAKDLDTHRWLVNSPKHLAKLNLSAPVWRDWLRAGTEVQYVGDRQLKASTAPGYAIVNLTLTATRIIPHLDISASVYNLLDKEYVNAAGDETIINQIPQNGRNYRIWLTYRF